MVHIARANREAIQKVSRHETCGTGNHRAQGRNLRHVRNQNIIMKGVDGVNLKNQKEITPQEPYRFTKRIGSTTYRVGVHFSETSKETLNDKIMRLVRNDKGNPAKSEISRGEKAVM